MERHSSLSVLAKHGFEELSETVSRLEDLVSLVGDSGHSALAFLSDTASPDRALLGMLRLAEASPQAVSRILSKAKPAKRLARLLAASDALSDNLVRFPEQLAFFGTNFDFPTVESALRHYENHVAINDTAASDKLRIEYRSLLMQIAVLDVEQDTPESSFQRTSVALSDLAAATLEFALRIAKQELEVEARYEFDALGQTQLSIIAMGKCGARELNYLSDVDVIFAYQGDHELSNEIATRLATRTMRVIDGPGVEPPLWQVDPNLRPEGKNGALVRSIESHVAYYQRWAENWEFQALLKARPVAGDADLGLRYINEVQSLIWTKLNRVNLVESVRKMRVRVLEHIPPAERERQIKLGRGGLRDVEFTAQLLQLVHGSEDASLRTPDTLGALNSLAESGFLGRGDAIEFANAYKVLRSIEHRVQLAQLRRTHLIPINPSEQRRIAHAFGSKTDLLDLWETTRSKVANLHDSVFYRPLLNAMASLESGDVRLTDDEVASRLEALGFLDTVGAINHITALTTGLTRRATIQKTLLPVLIRWLAEGVYPDRGLLAFRRLSESLGETPWFLRMLRDSAGAAQALMKLLSSSELIITLLEYIPESASWLDDDVNLIPKTKHDLSLELDSVIDRNEDQQKTAESIRFIRRREILRLAMGSVLEKLDLFQLAEGMTDLTDTYLMAMLRIAVSENSSDESGAPFEIIAMGRYGGREIGFGSDADVMLVRPDASPDNEEEVSKNAQKLAADFQKLVKDSLVSFELDLDLRPEGKKGPVVRSIDGYRNYYAKWADTWEFQALLKARPVSENSGLAKEFVALIDNHRYPKTLEARQIVEIRRIKARVESERLPQGADPLRHLKLGRGSISDVEWLVQLMQMRHGFKHEKLRSTGTVSVLRESESIGLLEKEDCEALVSAWMLASRVRSAIVLANGRQLDILPTDRIQLEAIARILEYPASEASQLEEDYLSSTRKARRVFERLFLN